MPEESLDIAEIVDNVFPYLKSINAKNNRKDWVNKEVKLERQVDLKYSIDKSPTDKFVILINDKVTFSPEVGPFDIDIQMGCFVHLKVQKTKEEIEQYLSIDKNQNYFKSHCLPQSSILVSFLTDKMGYSPLILNPAKVG